MREPINLSDSTQSVIIKMSEGNPGAVTVLMELLQRDDPARYTIVAEASASPDEKGLATNDR